MGRSEGVIAEKELGLVGGSGGLERLRAERRDKGEVGRRGCQEGGRLVGAR